MKQKRVDTSGRDGWILSVAIGILLWTVIWALLYLVGCGNVETWGKVQVDQSTQEVESEYNRLKRYQEELEKYDGLSIEVPQ